jgi:hypothetical protein
VDHNSFTAIALCICHEQSETLQKLAPKSKRSSKPAANWRSCCDSAIADKVMRNDRQVTEHCSRESNCTTFQLLHYNAKNSDSTWWTDKVPPTLSRPESTRIAIVVLSNPGEPLKLGFDVSQATVSRCMPRRGYPPTKSRERDHDDE